MSRETIEQATEHVAERVVSKEPFRKGRSIAAAFYGTQGLINYDDEYSYDYSEGFNVGSGINSTGSGRKSESASAIGPVHFDNGGTKCIGTD